MAEFCKACASLLLGDEAHYNDAKGLTPEEAWAKGEAVVFLCEGCGTIQVDPEGNCVSKDCFRAGEPGHGLPWRSTNGKKSR